jgi:hypothetical protein
MSGQTWGYAGQVGEWFGTLNIPVEHRHPASAAAHWVLSQVIPIFEGLHRPRKIAVSWAAVDSEGREIVFNELEEVDVAEWKAVGFDLSRLERGSGATLALSSLFISLDTSVIDDGTAWSDSSAELQISIPPPYQQPEVASVSYSTYIDIWLSDTYGEDNSIRSNHELSSRNRPRLEAMLLAFSQLVGDSYEVGESYFYDKALTKTGFRDQHDEGN